MTTTDIIPEQGRAHYTLPEDTGDVKSSTVLDSRSEPLTEASDHDTQVSPDEKIDTRTKKGSRAGPQVHPPPIKDYGSQWDWDHEAKDFTQIIDGKLVFYREYQRAGENKATTNQPAPSDVQSKTEDQAPPESKSEKNPASTEKKDPEREEYDFLDDHDAPKTIPPKRGSISSERGKAQHSRQNSIQKLPVPKTLKQYQEPLDEGFTIVEKPKRFFQFGRIFATIWFEPGGIDPPGRRADLEWTDVCPEYHGEKPIAKYRWFIVVRRRLHHSLCFNITTIGPNGPRWADRGRGQDFVVLHKSNIEPSKPFDTEGIEKEPIAVIIEGEESISPWARLDCGRIYTVEDSLRCMKVGRVHMASLEALETCYKQSVT